MQVGIDIGNESDGYRLTVGGYSGIHVDNDISNDIDGYRLTGGGYSVMPIVLILVVRVTDIVLHWEDTRGIQVGTDICDESDIYLLSVGDTRGAGKY